MNDGSLAFILAAVVNPSVTVHLCISQTFRDRVSVLSTGSRFTASATSLSSPLDSSLLLTFGSGHPSSFSSNLTPLPLRKLPFLRHKSGSAVVSGQFDVTLESSSDGRKDLRGRMSPAIRLFRYFWRIYYDRMLLHERLRLHQTSLQGSGLRQSVRSS